MNLLFYLFISPLTYLFRNVLTHLCYYLVLTTKRNSLRYPCSICSAHSSCGTEQFEPSITCVSCNCPRFYCRCTKLNRWMSRGSGKPTFQCWKKFMKILNLAYFYWQFFIIRMALFFLLKLCYWNLELKCIFLLIYRYIWLL